MRISRKQAYSILKKNLWKLVLASAGIIALSFLFGTSVITIATMIILIMVASFSTFYFNYVNAPVNFELVKLSTILVAYTQGIAAGLIVGILSTIVGKVLIGRIDEKLPISVVAISIVAVLASLFNEASIEILGIALVGLYNLTLFSVSVATGGDIGWNLPYEGTNFAINFVLFTRVAPLLLPLLA